MHITCEKCSTTYVLDDALIPPQGVPVQCTRCAHVFTAKVPTAAAPPPQPPAAQKPGNSTMMFGAPAVPPAAPKNSTMMFGGPTMSSPTPAPAPAAPAKNQTMMFGAPGAPVEPPKNQTMMFGAPGAPAEPPKNQTMMFGTPASNAAPPPPAAPAPAAGRSTMMFGAPASAPAPAKNQTMMFGTPASNAAAAAAPPESAAATTSKTLVFGGAPPVAAPKNQTMVFGTAASNAAAQASQATQAPIAPATKTQVYGDDSSEETIMENGPGQSSRTLIFGGPTERPSEPEPSKNQTMMFGRAPIPKVTAGTVELAGIAADENAPNESTVRVDESQVKSEQDDGSNTDTGEPQPPPRQERTQRFAMSDIAKPPERPRGPPMLEPVAPELNAEVESIDLSANQTLRPGQLDPSALGFDPHRTLPPDLQVTPPNPVAAIDRPDVVTPPAAFGATEPDLQKLETSPGYRLKLENPDTAPGLLGAPLDLQAAQDDAAMMRAAKKGGSGRAIVVVLLLIALALSALLVWRLFGKNWMGEQASEQALKQTGDAFALLRRDDALNQAKAVDDLRVVLAQNPALVEAQAALVMALAARFDDAQAELNSGEAHMAQVKAAGVAQAELDALQTVLTAQTEVVQRSKKQLDEAHARLLELGATVARGSPAESALVRADGFARGVKGDSEAISRAVQFAQLNPSGADAWAGLIEPEYALNGGTQLDEAVKQLQAMHDETFFRPAVLLARLELKRGNPDAAAEQLEHVVQLNDQHALAKALLKSIAK